MTSFSVAPCLNGGGARTVMSLWLKCECVEVVENRTVRDGLEAGS